VLTTNLARPATLLPRTNLVSLFQVKRGFRIELVAADPMVASPVAMAFDENGRLFIAEMRDYPNKRGQNPRLGRIRMLEDTHGKGTFDSSTIYADDLASASALACYAGGVFVAAAPEILYFKDVKGNGVAETRKVVFSGFGEPASALDTQDLLNNFNWGLDNRIHGASGDVGGRIVPLAGGGEPLLLGNNGFSFDPAALTLALESGSADSGCSFDNRGRKFVCDLAHPLRLVMYEKHYANRNPYFAAPVLVADALSPIAPIFKFVTAAQLGSGGSGPAQVNVGASGSSITSGWWTQARGCAVYRGSVFPPNYLNNIFIPDKEGHLIHRAVPRENGVEVIADRAPDEQNVEFLLSRDPSFHPVQIVNGPDGGLYVADIADGGDSGRIFRILPDNLKLAKPPVFQKSKTFDLVAALAHPNGWHRDTAARLLIERRDLSAIPLLTSMLNNAHFGLTRLHALHVLDGLGGINDAHLLRGLKDMDEAVREHAVLLSEKRIQNGSVSDLLWFELKQMAGDSSPRVRFQLALSLGQFRMPEKSQLLAQILSRNPDSSWVQAALLSSASQDAAGLLIAVAAGPGWADTGGEMFASRLATVVGLQNRPAEVQRVVNFLDRGGLNQQQVFALLYSLGEGLHRAGSSLAAADPQARLQRFYEQSLNLALNDSFADRVRLPAIRLRGVTPYTSYASGDIFQFMFGTRQSDAVQSATLFALARYANPEIPSNIFQRWQELTPVMRTRAIGALLTRGDWVEPVVAALETGIIRRSDLSSTEIDLLRNWPAQAIRERALRLLGPGSRRRPDVLAQFGPSLRMPGSMQHGRDIFAARCLICHKPSDGRQPLVLDLADVKPFGREKVLSSIVEPNAEVRPQMATHIIQTRAGEVWTGLLADDNPSAVTLLQPGQDSVVLPHDNISFLEVQSWSLMPAGLENGLSQQDMADLLEYLTPRN
jgi:putative membrane-bound dehydrogenase-like protein